MKSVDTKAGDHQELQHDVQEISTADVARFLEVVCVNKKDRLGTPWLTDSELFEALQNCGLLRGDPGMVKTFNESDNIPTKDDLITMADNQVYLSSLY